MFNWLDLYIGLGAIILFVIGIRAGFLRSLLSLFGTYLAVYITQTVAPNLIKAASFLSVEETRSGYVILFLVIFGIMYLVVEFLLTVLKNIIIISILGPIDNVLGGLLSIFKALVIAGMVIETILLLPLSDQQLKNINQSYFKDWAIKAFKKTYPLALSAAPKIKVYFSEQPMPAVDIKMITAEAGKIKNTLEGVLK